MKGLEAISEKNKENIEDLGDEIKKCETKLEEAKKNGDTEASDTYSKKIDSLKEELSESTKKLGEAEALEKKDALGASSDYYKEQMTSALEKGNKVEYDNAKERWAKEKVNEEAKEVVGESSLGASSDYYKKQMASALERGDKIEYDKAKSRWAKERADEEAKKALND